MPNYNKVTLLGHLTRDIELRTTQGGMAIAKFGMAINRKFKDQESTCFVDLTAWGKQAEILAQYVGKGDALFVDGRLEYSTWESQDGGKRSKLEVVVENFQFIGGKDGAGRSQDKPPRSDGGWKGGYVRPPAAEDDVPF